MFYIDASQFTWALIHDVDAYKIWLVIFFMGLLEAYHAIEEFGNSPTPLYSKSRVVRWTTYVLLIVITLGFGTYTSNDFIYFQF